MNGFVQECREFVAMLQQNGYKLQSLGDIKDRKTYDPASGCLKESQNRTLRKGKDAS